ncbi:MAG: hypothetical protein M3Q08_18410 [Pseudomonadota bacterium]|nr:hypothetical protein [Pseudomonadota bacterium]
MPRTTVPVQTTSRTAGLLAAYTAVAAVDGGQVAFDSTSRTILQVNNASAGALTITVNTGRTVDGIVVPGRAISVAAGATAQIGPFGQNYKTTVGSTDFLQFEVSGGLNVTAIKLGQADS